MSERPDIRPAVSEAVEWLVLLASGKATDEDLRALETWRRASPENEGSFRLLQRVKPVGEEMVRQPAVSRRAVLGGGTAVVAGIGALGLASPPLGLWPSFAEFMADHRTAPGQTLALRPSDGVAMELNSRTSISGLGSSDGIRLIEGETFVAIDRPRPFQVQARNARFLAENTSFNLETLAAGVRLGCLKGEVQCRTGDQIVKIRAGTEWRLSSQGDVSTRAISTIALAGWRSGTLSYDRAPLADVVEQFNRYRSAPIVLASSDVGARRVSGHFYTAKTSAAVDQLQQLLQLRVRRLPGDVILIS